MLATSAHSRASASASSQAVHLAKTANLRHARSYLQCSSSMRLACASRPFQAPRYFATTPATHLRDIFPAPDTPHIQKTPPAWPHHGYSYEEMMAIETAHRPPQTFGDWAAWKIVRLARYWMDVATGMSRPQKSDKKHPTTSIVAEKPLTEAQWVGCIPVS